MSTRLVRSVIKMLQSQLTMGTLHPEISRTLGTFHSYIVYNAGYRYANTGCVGKAPSYLGQVHLKMLCKIINIIKIFLMVRDFSSNGAFFR